MRNGLSMKRATVPALTLSLLVAGCGETDGAPPEAEAQAAALRAAEYPDILRNETVTAGTLAEYDRERLARAYAEDRSIGLRFHGFEGAFTLEDVGPDEVVRIVTDTDAGHVALSVSRWLGDPVPELPRSESVHIDGRGEAVFLEDRVFEGDLVVRGSDLAVIGHAPLDCRSDAGTRFTGDIILEGKRIDVVDVTFEGEARIRSEGDASVWSPCQGSAPLEVYPETEY